MMLMETEYILYLLLSTAVLTWLMYHLLTLKANRVRGSDIPWLYDRPENRMIINGFVCLDSMQPSDLLRLIKERVLPGRDRLKQYVVYQNGTPVWTTDSSYQPENHVSVYPQEEGESMSYEDLQNYIGTHFNRAFPANRPPYEFILVERYLDNQSAIICRSHHVIADGIGFVGMMLGAVDSTDNDSEGLEKKIAKMKLSTFQLLTRVPMIPYCWLKTMLLTEDANPLHNGTPLSGNRCFSSSPDISLTEVKMIKSALNCTVNDLLMACLAGAFRTYFANHSTSVPDVAKHMKVAVPVSMRSAAQMKRITLCNKISVVIVPLDIDSSDRTRRLLNTAKSMNSIKDSAEPLAAFLAFKCFSILPTGLQRFLITYGASKCTTILTNVPGPTEPLHYFDKQVHHLSFVPPSMGSCGMGVSIISYNNSVRIGISTDASICAAPQELVQAFVHEFQQYLKLAGLAGIKTGSG